MGYTHYLNFSRERVADIKDGDKKFKKAVDLFKKCLEKLPDLKLGDGLGKGEPIITYEEVCFNGRAELGEDYETFRIQLNEPIKSYNKFCKTQHQPYDIAVCLALLCFKNAFGRNFSYKSDGFCPIDKEVISGKEKMNEGWQEAVDIMNSIKQ